MAEAIAREVCGGAVRFSSAGLYAVEGARATGHAVAAVSEIGIDAGGHRARVLTPEMVAAADVILVMSAAHRDSVLAEHPEASGKVHLLDPQGVDVADPYGGSDQEYRAARDHIAAAIEARHCQWQEPDSAE